MIKYQEIPSKKAFYSICINSKFAFPCNPWSIACKLNDRGINGILNIVGMLYVEGDDFPRDFTTKRVDSALLLEKEKDSETDKFFLGFLGCRRW